MALNGHRNETDTNLPALHLYMQFLYLTFLPLILGSIYSYKDLYEKYSVNTLFFSRVR